MRCQPGRSLPQKSGLALFTPRSLSARGRRSKNGASACASGCCDAAAPHGAACLGQGLAGWRRLLSRLARLRAWRAACAEPRAAPQVNVPKAKKTYCKKCKKHAAHKVTQYKTGKASLFAQGAHPGRTARWSPRAGVAARRRRRAGRKTGHRGRPNPRVEAPGRLNAALTRVRRRQAPLRRQAERLRRADQARVPQEGASCCHTPRRACGAPIRRPRPAHAAAPRRSRQAKTTKKIVLRLQCATCKFTHQHAIKARPKTQRRAEP